MRGHTRTVGGSLAAVAGVVLGGIGSAAADSMSFTWGHEEPYENRVAILEEPFMTRPERVEVIWVYWYTASAGGKPNAGRLDRLMREWAESLPERVEVRRYPGGLFSEKARRRVRESWWRRWERHQQALFTARLAGKEEEVHRALVRSIVGDWRSLDRDSAVHELLRGHGVPDGEIERWFRGPEVGGLKLEAAQYSYLISEAARRQGFRRQGSKLRPPLLLVDGRYAVLGNTVGRYVGGPRRVLRVANRLIREALEGDRVSEGPRNDEEFVSWIAPRAGELVWRQQVKGVFNAWRKEFWMLDGQGEVEHVGRLVGEGDGSYFRLPLPGHVVHVPLWKSALQWRSYAGQPRYGAFLLTDYLSGPDTHWVGLPFKGREVALAFSPDGRVEAHNEKGQVFGSWWLEAGNLNVSFGELGVQSWPWQKAAAYVGLEIPQSSMTPWDPKRTKKKVSDARDGK